MTKDVRKFRGEDLRGVEVVQQGTGTRMSALCRSVGEPLEKLDWKFKTSLLLTGNPLTTADRKLIRMSILFLRIDADYHLQESRRRA